LLVIVSGGEAPPDTQIRAAMRSLGIGVGENEPSESSSTQTQQDDMNTSEPSPLTSNAARCHLDKHQV
jgi:hypothetical protein